MIKSVDRLWAKCEFDILVYKAPCMQGTVRKLVLKSDMFNCATSEKFSFFKTENVFLMKHAGCLLICKPTILNPSLICMGSNNLSQNV